MSRLKACVHARTHTHTHTHTRTHTRTHAHTHTRTHTHTHTHTHTQTRTLTHTHTCISAHKAHTNCQFTAQKASPTFQHRLRCFPPLVISMPHPYLRFISMLHPYLCFIPIYDSSLPMFHPYLCFIPVYVLAWTAQQLEMDPLR